MPIEIKDDDIQKASAMAKRLEKVLENCNKIEDKDIPVPLDVRGRMKALCSETEKILNDIPNKKFSVAVHMHAGGKAKKYLETLGTELQRAFCNCGDFNELKKFYGVSGENVKSDVKKYSDKMKKYADEINNINGKINDLIKDHSDLLSGHNYKGLVISNRYEEDDDLINFGKICKGNINTYFGYVKAFFGRFIDYEKVNDKPGIVNKFTDVSNTLRKLKGVVARNEAKILGNGIQETRNHAYELMWGIKDNLKEYLKEANHCVEFLNGLYIKSPELSIERDNGVTAIETAIQDYNKRLAVVEKFRSSIKYGETTFNVKGDQKKLAMGTKKVRETFFDAASVRDRCNNFIKDLNYVLSGIKNGQKINIIFKKADKLNRMFDNLVVDIDNFLNDAKDFKGYYDTSTDKKNELANITEVDKDTLRSVHAKYKDICDELTKIKIDNMYATKEIGKLEKMEEKIKKEVEEYNKVSSKIKRGVKRVFGVMGTIARYTLNVTEFLKNVLFISSTWTGLSQSLAKNDQTAAQVNVPIISN